MTHDIALCEACGFPLHPLNEIVRAASIRQGGAHNKPVVVRGERVVLFHEACWGSGVGGFEATDRGKLEDVAARNWSRLPAPA
jgi:hypothetical protein